MAGESPGRSDQQKSSGETARGESDPRLAISREAEAAQGSTAVAVVSDDLRSGSGEPQSASDEPDVTSEAASGTRAEAEAEAEPKAPVADGDDANVSGVRDGERGEGSGTSGAKDEPEADSGAADELGEGDAPEPDVEPEADADDADDADGEDGADADADAEVEAEGAPEAEAKAEADDDGDGPSEMSVDQRTAVFRTVKPKADGDAKAEGASEGEGEGEGEGDEDGGESSESAVDQRTAVFRTVKPKADADAKAEDASEAETEGDEDGDEPSKPSVDQRTAVFRTVKPKTDGDAQKKEGAEEGEPTGASEKAAASDADDDASDKPVDRATAAFGVLPEKPGKGGKKGVDQPTTAFKAVSPPADKKTSEKASDAKTDAKASEAKASEKTPAKKPAAESDNERTSKFVPLRSPDDPAPSKPSTAPTAPAASSAPAAPPAGVPEAERTKQQPLPPLSTDGKQPAPLDLLAQLTNTPPKPETPMRTAVRRVKIWTPLAALLVIILGVVQALRPLPEPALKLTADASYRFGGGELSLPWPGQGQSAAEVEGVGSLGTSGDQKPVPIASVTKVMTAYVVLKDHPLKGDAEGPKITIDAQAAEEAKSADESRAAVKEGQTFTQHQLLQLLLINSSNNIARLLARWDAGSLDAFVKKMNDAAEGLGMKQTTYTDPSGLKESTKSTAADQLKLAKAAMQSEAFRAVVATPNAEIPGLGDRIYNNNNLLVKPGVIGIKTGSSTPAGGALMWGAVRTIDGKKQRILGVVLEQRATTTLDASLQLAQTNSYKLISTLQDALTSATVIKKGDVVGQIDDGLGGTTPVVATKELKAVGWSGLGVDIKIGDGGKKVPHSAKAGTVVGEVTVGTGPGQLTAPVALQGDLPEPSFGAKLTRIG
ncbi:D-alanyl-D-alanine carboxypeptidase family protein [Streptomyces violaceusniger]|uniref:Peptidase S11 D-alanyl-D-alanine carboxypeptidase 1 n=1 Tax=Streptomyces violaceusniger (strain Tu 4113) TaxID=653045 RepID=G2NSQ5_STRV4|nr:D-alanyl-D-alanine carboxypeptidase [Streptomyces violaceusniger]AEM80793.1 peptidase S11 D-alanyl-D-alanine carboxypeptidase 1 [Streptomyces violaceusniger Tu 4113]